jgi:S1-C subfamily serine protease
MAKNVLMDLSESLVQAVEVAGASTVMVDGRRRVPAGGIAYAAELILTAHHMLERDEDIRVTLTDGSELGGVVQGRDPASDLALLRLERAAAEPAAKAKQEARVGQIALALGRPTRGGIEASLGVVSAIAGPLRTHRGGTLERYLRTDTVPYPGFSGGPLVAAEGADRRRVLVGIFPSLQGSGDLNDWLARSPLVEIEFLQGDG